MSVGSQGTSLRRCRLDRNVAAVEAIRTNSGKLLWQPMITVKAEL